MLLLYEIIRLLKYQQEITETFWHVPSGGVDGPGDMKNKHPPSNKHHMITLPLLKVESTGSELVI